MAVKESELIRLTEVHRWCEAISDRRWTPDEFRNLLASEGIPLWEKRGKVSKQFSKDAITLAGFVRVCSTLTPTGETNGR